VEVLCPKCKTPMRFLKAWAYQYYQEYFCNGCAREYVVDIGQLPGWSTQYDAGLFGIRKADLVVEQGSFEVKVVRKPFEVEVVLRTPFDVMVVRTPFEVKVVRKPEAEV